MTLREQRKKILALGLSALRLCVAIKHTYWQLPHLNHWVMAPDHCACSYSFSPLPELLSVSLSSLLSLFVSRNFYPPSCFIMVPTRSLICDCSLFLGPQNSFIWNDRPFLKMAPPYRNKWISSPVLACRAEGVSAIPNPSTGFQVCGNSEFLL